MSHLTGDDSLTLCDVNRPSASNHGCTEEGASSQAWQMRTQWDAFGCGARAPLEAVGMGYHYTWRRAGLRIVAPTLATQITLWRLHTVPENDAGVKKPINVHDG